jgi:branched-chain amino acid transport system substrate-binding protein
MRSRTIMSAVAVTAAATLLLAACGGSSSGGNTGTTGSAKTGTYKLGVLVDETGPGSNLGGGVDAVKAYVNYVNNMGGINGAKLSYVVADSMTTPAGALAGAEKLVEQDHVFAIVSVALMTFAAEPYLLKHGVPVVGTGQDGPEWNDPTNTNMFTTAPADYTKIYSTAGQFFKSVGGTSCATISYSDSPSASAAARNASASCLKAGLKSPSLQLFKYATTDVGPIALSIKNSGADTLYALTSPTIGFGVAAVLQELGVKFKSILFATGYGGDLLASPAGVKAAQGYDFQSSIAPIEINNAATQLMAKNLAAVGINADPTYGQQVAYQGMTAFAAGMKAVGANASQADFIKGLRAVKGFTADGLLAAPIDFDNYSPATQCFYVVKLSGKVFTPLQTKPYCGGVVGTAKSS